MPHIHSNSAYLLLLIATAGTTITPYMQLYLQSAVVERGVREEELPHEEREAVLGAVFANVIASFIIIATGGHAVHAWHPQHLLGGGCGARADPVRRPLRRGAVRDRPAGSEPARRRDPADRHLLRDLRVAGLREGRRAAGARRRRCS